MHIFRVRSWIFLKVHKLKDGRKQQYFFQTKLHQGKEGIQKMYIILISVYLMSLPLIS